MDDDGANQRNLTDSTELDLRPTWVPDAKKIAFESNRNGPRDIFILDLENGTYTSITGSELQSWERLKLMRLQA